MESKRSHQRTEGRTYSEISIIIQDGLMSHKIIPTLVDSSPGGAQFITDRNENIKTGLTALIHCVSEPDKDKNVIESEIIWVRQEMGKVLFGCKFLSPEHQEFALA
ncbi:hypothetical protein MNBD_NITROSPINAE03-697 [hydrothermal vent metagenome]|uniref:PilZ domain-containing protein n=1 Tax=hydrothermal vent metagenome TaxID=652676 RepID=A0A3B1BQC2_9ZZZZ